MSMSMSMHGKAHHRPVAEAARNSRNAPRQQEGEASRGLVAEKRLYSQPEHEVRRPHQKQHSQHPPGGGVVREPLRQHPNGQPVQRRRITNKQVSANQSSQRLLGSSTLESVKDATESELDPAEESALAAKQQAQQQQPKPCLDRTAWLPDDLPDVDRNGHCTMVSAYAKDIFVYLAERELDYALPMNFLAGHAEVSERSRAILVDWLLQLSSRLELQADTYHLAVRLLDHYLAIDRSVAKRQLQLLGATALWLASKFEEVYCISVADLLHVCSGAYNRRDLLAMEVRLVGALDFRLLPPLPITFLRRLSKVAEVENRLHYAAKYLLELATLCATLASRPASLLAAAAMRIALGTGGRGWSDVLTFYSGYTAEDLRPAVADLARACVAAAAPSSLPALSSAAADSRHHHHHQQHQHQHHRFVYQKYRSAKCFAVSACAQLRPDSQYLADLIAQDIGCVKD